MLIVQESKLHEEGLKGSYKKTRVPSVVSVKENSRQRYRVLEQADLFHQLCRHLVVKMSSRGCCTVTLFIAILMVVELPETEAYYGVNMQELSSKYIFLFGNV